MTSQAPPPAGSRAWLVTAIVSPLCTAFGSLVTLLARGEAGNPLALVVIVLSAMLIALLVAVFWAFYIEYRERSRRMEQYLTNWVTETQKRIELERVHTATATVERAQ